MAKKKKRKSTNAESMDINQVLIDNMQLDQEPAPEPEKATEDEFAALLRSFIDEDTSDEETPASSSEPEEVDLGIEAEEDGNAAKTLRRDMSQLNLSNDENELAQAYANFLDAVCTIAENQNLSLPDFYFEAENLVPNYKPSTGRKIVADAMLCWDILFKAYPEKLSTLSPSASDEEFLNFAEGLSDQNLQLSIISYVEILIDIENCELSYEEKRLKAQRRRIERQLYEEYNRRQEMRKKFIDEISRRRFPVDAERLINNYFKTAAKDVDGAYQALIQNPAVYAPIDISKIKPRFFGLLKVTPKDGIRENHRLGEFLKKLKV